MNLIIKGLDMPLTCWGCPCFDDEITHYCGVLDRYCDDYKNNRLNDCPLAEIPTPHGDLIDKEPIKKFIVDGINKLAPESYGYDGIEILAEIEFAPVIIEAEAE